MKKLSYLLAVLAFLAFLAGLAVALMSFLERRKSLLTDDDYEQELYRGGQEYYAEDFNLESSGEDSQEDPAAPMPEEGKAAK